jgi:hypothetical protein
MKRHATAWVILLVVLGAAAVWYLNARQPVGPHPSAIDLPQDPVAEPVPQEPEYPIEVAQPEAGPDEPIETAPLPEPLPALAESDPYMVAVLVDLLGAGPVEALLMTEQFVSRVVATVDSLAGRQVAPLVMPLRPPGGSFLVTGPEDAPEIAPANAARYQSYVDLLARLDPDQLVAVYVRNYALFQEAYEALGYPDAYFNDRLVQVIDHLLATPASAWPPRLAKPEAVYLYADEGLEALSAGQKLLIRIGPEHGRAVRSWLVEFRAAVTRSSPGEE